MSMTDVQKIELLRTELARIQVLRQAALQNMQAALGDLEGAQDQADAGLEGMRVAKENFSAAKAALATLQQQEDKVAQNLANLREIIGAAEQIAADTETTDDLVEEPPTEPEPDPES